MIIVRYSKTIMTCPFGIPPDLINRDYQTASPYTYGELLGKLVQQKSLDEVHAKINLPIMKVTQVNRSSIIVNFDKFPTKLKRSADHISAFFKSETGLSNSINERGQLIIQGLFSESKCQSIIRNYIKNFVMCKQCKSIDSTMYKESGLNFLQCHQCQAVTSLGKI